jgi:hypothetical protein
MELSHIAFLLFATFSALRSFSYLPQIHRVAIDDNGASAISYSTWTLWTGANVATAFYAVVNLHDVYLASVSVIYTVCCVVVIVLTIIKRRRFHSRRCPSIPVSAPRPFKAQPSRWHRPALGVALGGLAAIAVGLGAGWAFPDGVSAANVTIARHGSTEVTDAASANADEAEPAARPAVTGQPVRPSPARAAEEPRPSPPAEAATAPDKSGARKRRSSSGRADIAANKDRLRARDRYGDFDYDL